VVVQLTFTAGSEGAPPVEKDQLGGEAAIDNHPLLAGSTRLSYQLDPARAHSGQLGREFTDRDLNDIASSGRTTPHNWVFCGQGRRREQRNTGERLNAGPARCCRGAEGLRDGVLDAGEGAGGGGASG
jgi:hypothetical protein